MRFYTPKTPISVTIVTISAPSYLIVIQTFTKNRSRSADFFVKKTQECARACAREKRKKKASFGLKEGTFSTKRTPLFPIKNAPKMILEAPK
jgi:hypothetical protein